MKEVVTKAEAVAEDFGRCAGLEAFGVFGDDSKITLGVIIAYYLRDKRVGGFDNEFRVYKKAWIDSFYNEMDADYDRRAEG